jgi:HD superfamily phosphohydrolase
MWHHLLQENPDVRQLLDGYLSPDDYTFIEELIMPPKNLIENGQWLPKGRPIQKSFLFGIISNPFDGLDVDKLDYFIRDAKNANVSHEFGLVILNISVNISSNVLGGN